MLTFHGEGPFFLFACDFVKQKKNITPLAHPPLCMYANIYDIAIYMHVCLHVHVSVCVYISTIKYTQGVGAGNLINKHMLTLIIDF